jgi:phenylalanyl-tRNA synthetase beta chain
VGEVAGNVQAAYDLPGRVYAFELNLEALLETACLLREHAPLPRFPAALRDVALLVDDDEAHAAARIAEAIAAAGGEHLRAVRPFDLYRDEKRLGAGKKSLAFSLEFRAADRTLTDDEVDAAMAAIIAHLQAAMAAEVRKA